MIHGLNCKVKLEQSVAKKAPPHSSQIPMPAFIRNNSSLYVVHILQSLGATTEIFGFMPGIDVLKMQAVCKLMYRSGVGRVQASFSGPDKHYFTFPYGEGRRRTVYIFNGNADLPL